MSSTARRGGRPRLAAAESRTEQIAGLLTPAEKEAVYAEAADAGISVSDLVRARLANPAAPRTGPAENAARPVRLKTLVTPAERDALFSEAEQFGCTISDLVRHRVLGEPLGSGSLARAS